MKGSRLGSEASLSTTLETFHRLWSSSTRRPRSFLTKCHGLPLKWRSNPPVHAPLLPLRAPHIRGRVLLGSAWCTRPRSLPRAQPSEALCRAPLVRRVRAGREQRWGQLPGSPFASRLEHRNLNRSSQIWSHCSDVVIV